MSSPYREKAISYQFSYTVEYARFTASEHGRFGAPGIQERVKAVMNLVLYKPEPGDDG
jgi:hypothetical protein